LRARSLEDFFDLTRALERFDRLSLKGNGVFIATFPGREGVIVMDLLEQEGLRLAEISVTISFPAMQSTSKRFTVGSK
jgi:acyl-CoA synthetase (NDP forming)